MIQVIGVPVGSDPAPFSTNLFLTHKEADWVKLGTINVRKINNSFQFIDDLQSLNDSSTFEKHYKDTYPTELELRKENNSNSWASFLNLYICIENGEFHTTLFDKQDNFGFKIIRYHFTAPMCIAKCSLRALEQGFLEFLEQRLKLKIFLIIVNSC